MNLDYNAAIRELAASAPTGGDLETATASALAEIACLITSALHAKAWDPGKWEDLRLLKAVGVNDGLTLTSYVGNTVAMRFADATVEILKLMAARGMEVCAADNAILAFAPKGFAPGSRDGLAPFVWDLVATLARRRREDMELLEALKFHEREESGRPLPEEILEELPEDMRTAKLLENYILGQPLCCAMTAMAAWCKVHEPMALDELVRERLGRD